MADSDAEPTARFSPVLGILIGILVTIVSIGLASQLHKVVPSIPPIELSPSDLALQVSVGACLVGFLTGFFAIFTPVRIVLLIFVLGVILFLAEDEGLADLLKALPVAALVIYGSFLGDRARRWQNRLPLFGDDNQSPVISETWNYIRMKGEGWWLVPETLYLVLGPHLSFKNLDRAEQEKVRAAAQEAGLDLDWVTNSQKMNAREETVGRERANLEASRLMFEAMRRSLFRRAGVRHYALIHLSSVIGGLALGALVGWAFLGEFESSVIDPDAPPVENLGTFIKTIGSWLVVPGAVIFGAATGRLVAHMICHDYRMPLRWAFIWPAYIIGAICVVLGLVWTDEGVRAVVLSIQN